MKTLFYNARLVDVYSDNYGAILTEKRINIMVILGTNFFMREFFNNFL